MIVRIIEKKMEACKSGADVYSLILFVLFVAQSRLTVFHTSNLLLVDLLTMILFHKLHLQIFLAVLELPFSAKTN